MGEKAEKNSVKLVLMMLFISILGVVCFIGVFKLSGDFLDYMGIR